MAAVVCVTKRDTTYVVELTCRTPLCMVSMGAFAPFPVNAFPAMLDESIIATQKHVHLDID